MVKNRKYISKRTRVQVLSRDDNKCRMCGTSADKVPLEVDHILPHSRHGTDDIDNLASLCRDCNRGKSDLYLQSMLKQKVEVGDFTPIGEVEITVDFVKLHMNSKLHEYELSVKVNNKTSKTIVNPQLEIKLPSEAIKINSGGQIQRKNKLATIFFPKLDVERIHPQKTSELMTTSNIGLYYKMNDSIYWDDDLMESSFEVTLYGDDMQPVVFKKQFKEMQCY